MGCELAFVLINPYTIAKSRTGGVIARYTSRTDLDFVAARMFRPSRQLVQEYADHLRRSDSKHPETCRLLADYMLKSYSPDPETNRPRRVMMLLFEGEDAVHKIWQVTGSTTLKSGSGQTIRDTYGDYIVGPDGQVQYFEPAVLVGPTRERAAVTLRLWARYAETDAGLVETAADVPQGEKVEKTLVLLKPDNFRYRSSRPGNIIDVLSRSGLRIVGVKKFCMTVAQAEEFYGPVRQSLEEKFEDIGRERLADALCREFGFEVPPDALKDICAKLAPPFAQSQFESIVKFMTGYKPSECSRHDRTCKCREECLALVYEGEEAVITIRSLLGPTDPRKAAPGSVRREYGSDIMVNAAHASDSVENARRELKIIGLEEDTISPWVARYYGSPLQRAKAKLTGMPRRLPGFVDAKKLQRNEEE